MVVDHPCCLHMGIYYGRTNKLEAAPDKAKHGRRLDNLLHWDYI